MIFYKKAKRTFDRQSIYSVRENYTEMVQLHRRELGRRLVEACGKGEFACMQFDKLIIEGNVYTYDEGTNQIVRIGAARDRRRPIQERDISINHGDDILACAEGGAIRGTQ